MHAYQFTILIGSYARGDATPESDVDVMRIGHQKPFIRLDGICPSSHISYIDYDWHDLMKLHSQGSLFLHHSFTEGRLLLGSESEWNKLKASFSVATRHAESIAEYVELLTYIDSYPGYEDAYLPYLSNVFKAVKNIGIFRLAESGTYFFDKKTALTLGCGIAEPTSRILQAANNCYERAAPPSKEQILQFRDAAIEWKSQSRNFIGIIAS
jgi:predicted nucleotidyltransferase